MGSDCYDYAPRNRTTLTRRGETYEELELVSSCSVETGESRRLVIWWPGIPAPYSTCVRKSCAEFRVFASYLRVCETAFF